MKASELRIGNRIINAKGENIIVDNITIGICFGLPKTYKPIPLTEKWLTDFGCEQKSVNRYPDGKLVNYVSLDNINPKTDYGSGFEFKGDNSDQLFLCDCDGGKIGNQIEYVHQLQNLYFALTGEELELKK